jgi:hypothetical protein
MAIAEVYHSGFLSSIKYDNLSPWYTTTSNNQTIEFKDSNGNQRQLNSLTIFSDSTPLYIRILPSDYCIYIPPNSFISYDFQRVEKIQVMGNSGQKIRWYGMFG